MTPLPEPSAIPRRGLLSCPLPLRERVVRSALRADRVRGDTSHQNRVANPSPAPGAAPGLPSPARGEGEDDIAPASAVDTVRRGRHGSPPAAGFRGEWEGGVMFALLALLLGLGT